MIFALSLDATTNEREAIEKNRTSRFMARIAIPFMWLADRNKSRIAASSQRGGGRHEERFAFSLHGEAKIVRLISHPCHAASGQPMRTARLSIILILTASLAGLAEPANRKVEKNPAIKPLSPEASMKHIKLPPGFRIELVASEPQIREPVGRISRHEDTDGDGRMDKHTVYLDGLVEPRAILAVDDGLLVGEPPDLWYCRDIDGDGKADTKELAFDRFSMRMSNVEHKANGLLWGIDNWIHVSQHGHRYQFINRKLRNEKVPVVGQWGLARNDEGRFLFSSNGTPATLN